MKALMVAVLATALMTTGLPDASASQNHGRSRHDPVFAEGGVMAGASNGLSFDTDGNLYVANVFGATITKIDPDTGEILERLTTADLVFFPDDLIVGPDGTLYWTEIALGGVVKRPPGGPSQFLVPPFGLNSANPLVLSDDGTRLFAAGCYGGPPDNNAMVEIDPVTGGIVNTLRADVPGCASNGMAWQDGALYAPQPYGDSVLRVDVDSGDITEVTTGWSAPVGVAFDSTGDLYGVSQGAGDLVRIDLTDPDIGNNREVVSTFPVGWVDNLAFDQDDRLFVSSASDGAIVEVLEDGSQRVVVAGQFGLPMGVATIGNTLYTVSPQQIIGWDRKTRKRTSIVRSVFGIGPLPASTNVVAWRDQLVLVSAITGQFVIWDPATNTPTYQTLLAAPGDVEPFLGDLIVTETGTGNVVRLSGNDLSVSTVIATGLPTATGLAATNNDVYVADAANGTVLQLIVDGDVLDTPLEVASGLSTPEGLDVRGNRLLVVESGTQSLTEIHLKTGARRTIATDLGFMDPIPGVSPFGWFNNVTTAGNDIYVNADRANVIYELDRSSRRR